MRKLPIALIGVALLTLGACSSADDAGGTDDAAATPEASAEASSEASSEPSEPAADAGGAAVVEIATTGLGDVLVDGDGMTLYMFDPDAQGASTCYDDCAAKWPPLLTDGTPTAGTGADDSKIATTERTDGTTQVTYGGWPVYYWVNDAAVGDTTGQAVGGVWWVLDADGTPLKTS